MSAELVVVIWIASSVYVIGSAFGDALAGWRVGAYPNERVQRWKAGSYMVGLVTLPFGPLGAAIVCALTHGNRFGWVWPRGKGHTS